MAARSRVYSSPIGPLKLTATEDGILAVKFLFGKHEEVGGVSAAVTQERGGGEEVGGVSAAVTQERGGGEEVGGVSAAVTQERGGGVSAAVTQERGGGVSAAVTQERGGGVSAAVTQERGGGEDSEEEEAERDSIAESHLNVCSKWLDAYFQGTLLKSEAPPPPRPKLALGKKGSFSHTVWDTLLSTSIGDTLSYKELATLSGNPKASRAVGQAVKKHCIPILVPCHRVVKSGGGKGRGSEVGNYSGGDGTTTKVWLLEHEKDMVTKSS